MPHPPPHEPVEILLVDDSPTDALLAREALELAGTPHVFNVAVDGVEAMARLRGEGRFATVRLPDLILLDLNMPRMDGRAVLAELKRDARLRRIPVVVLTTSQAEEDVRRAYDLHANCYVAKPLDFDRFAEVIKTITDVWFGVATLPPRRPS